MTSETPQESADGLWCVVANVKKDHPFGPGGHETKSGTRLFRGGAKVYIAGCYPGTCDAVVAIGFHRQSKRLVTSVVDVRHVENFRVKVAYHPEVVRRIEQDERCWIRGKEEAERWAVAFPAWQKLRDRQPSE